MDDRAEILRRQMEEEYRIIRAGKKPAGDPGEWKPVPYKEEEPASGVTLTGGLFRRMFRENIRYVKKSFACKDYCEDKTWIEALADLTGNGWYPWLPASNDGRVLGGAANSWRWERDPELREIVGSILARIEKQMRPDGYFNYYPESDSYDCRNRPEDSLRRKLFSERKNYDRVFWTRGMIAAGNAGFPKAFALLRRMYDWFDRAEDYLPDMLCGFNATNGLPGGPLVYHTPVGRPEDLTVTRRFYDQDYWMDALTRRVPESFSHYPGERPHCYALLELEALLDEYRATGSDRYLQAALGGWEVYRGGYEQIGGSTAICEENGPYPYGSRYITTGCVGETCGSVFWIWINHRLLRLFPEEEKYAAEMELSLYNVLAACRTPGGRTRYHNRLHGKKEKGSFAGSCCEVSSTLLLSDLPGLVYTLGEDSVSVDLYAASALETETLSLRTETDFPRSNEVKITLLSKNGRPVALRLRVPRWNGGDLTVYENGRPVARGKPGTFITLKRAFSPDRPITFSLSPRLRAEEYRGWDQGEKGRRFAVLYGPVLMAFRGDFDPRQIPVLCPDLGDGQLGFSKIDPLHYAVNAGKLRDLVPYYEVQEETFTCFPQGL